MASANVQTEASQSNIAPSMQPLPPPKSVDTQSVLKRFVFSIQYYSNLVLSFDCKLGTFYTKKIERNQTLRINFGD